MPPGTSTRGIRLPSPSFRVRQALVLVHGGGSWLYTYRYVIAPLSRSFSVHALDLPGYGYTTMPQAAVPMNLSTMTSALKDFMTALGLDNASFVGHSWGGGWVLAFAMAFPAMVDRLVLMDSSGLDVPDVMEWELLKIPVLGRSCCGSSPRAWCAGGS
jgi:pimeloyl-ACP methyl ester carboxylesterase